MLQTQHNLGKSKHLKVRSRPRPCWFFGHVFHPETKHCYDRSEIREPWRRHHRGRIKRQYFCWLIINMLTVIVNKYEQRHFVFSCPEQLNRWPCHWLSDILILTLQSDPRDLWQLRHLISSDDLTFRVFSNGAIMGTCDICDTDYNTDNWEPGLMTIFVAWHLIVTLDSIRNSCDV